MDANKRLKSASGVPVAAAATSHAYQAPHTSRPSATIQQGNGRQILKITTKPHRLRRAINADDASDEDGDQSIQATPPPGDNGSESDAATRPVPRAARAARNNKRPIVESPESESEDEEMEDDEDDEGQETSDEDSEDDAGGEDADNDEDELAAHPSAPLKKTAASGRSKISITVPPKGSLKSAEAKEQELNDDEDEELSELESPDIGNDNEGGDDGLDDSDEDEFSRSATPDLAKLTKRQRGHFVAEPEVGNLLALSNEAQKKKHLTAEEHAMRRAEMARRRKNLSEKRNEEEKMDTINKLLKKPAPKRRTRAEIIAQQKQQNDSMATSSAEDGEREKPDPLYVRWVNNSSGSRIGVPEEWTDNPIGDVFRRSGGKAAGRMVEEVK